MTLQDLFDWVRGDLSSTGRIWSALAPALTLGAYFLVGGVVYIVRSLFRGGYHDEEVYSRGATPFLGMRARMYFAWVMKPVWTTLRRFDVPPNAVTTLSVLLAFASAIALAVGRFSLGGWLYLLAGACDFVDGRLARITGTASDAGAALDSILDRYAESAVLVGLAWFYRDSWVLLAVLASLVGSWLVPYIRARGEGLGVEVKVGIMQRPERLVLLGVALAFSPIIEALLIPNDPRPLHRVAVLALVLLGITTQFTALQRLFTVLDKLTPARRKVAGETAHRLKHLVSAIIATVADFGAVILLVDHATVDPRLATGLGCAVGGLINFVINRVWTFGSTAPALGQAGRYVFVSASSAGLNSGGVAILLMLPGLDYRLAWAIVRASVFLAWNYPLQRDYVFRDHADSPEPNPAAV